MKALVWEAPRRMALRDWEQPSPEADEILIEVAYAGICGSELGGYLGHNALRVPPLVMGHEFAGTIAALGDDVEPRWAVGDKVTCNPMVACGTCAHCRNGLPHLCSRRSLVGAHRPGAFAEFVSVPQRAVHKLPDGMSLRLGAMVEPVAVAVRIGRMAGEIAGRTALVIGAGPIGLLALQALQQRGAARVFVSDIDPARLAMAGELGADTLDAAKVDVVKTVVAATDGLGAEVSVDAVGSAQTRAQSVAATRSAGRVLLSGLHEESSAFPASEVIRREIEVRGTFCYDTDDFRDAIAAVAAGTMRLDPWTVEAPLGDGQAWFDRLVASPGAVSKVLLIP